MTLYLALTAADPAGAAGAGIDPAGTAPPFVGVLRGWRYRGRHADRWDLGDYAFGALVVAVAAAVLLFLAPKVAAADRIPDRPARVTVAPGSEHRNVLAAAQAWARLMEDRDHAGKYDMWTAAAKAAVSKADYLAAMRCAPPLDEPYVVRNLRVDQVYVGARTAVAWYWGESFRALGPMRFRATTWHLFHVLELEAGAWRHRPYADVEDGSLAAQVKAQAAACRPT